MKKVIFAFLALLLFTSFSFAAYSNLPPQVQSALYALKKYPESSTILLWSQESYSLDGKGTQTTEVHQFRYFSDDVSRDSWGDPRLNYTSENKLEVLTARVYNADGRKIDYTPNALNETTPDALEKCPEFNSYKQMVVTLLGLENGSICELHYRYTETRSTFPVLSRRIYLRESYPMIAHEIKVQLPEGRELNYKLSGGAPEPQKNGSVYRWTIGETDGYSAKDLGKGQDQLPQISFSTIKDWGQFQVLLKGKITQSNSDSLIIPLSLQSRLLGVSDAENRLDTIKAWLNERFTTINYEDQKFSTQLRSSRAVLHSGYGNSFETAVLVSKLSNQLGLTTAVMLQYDGEALTPTLAGIKGALVEFRTNDTYFLTDPLAPRSEISQASLVGNTLVPITAQGSAAVMPSINYSSNRFQLHLSLKDLTADTLKGFGTLVTTGQLAPYEVIREGEADAYLESVVHLKGLKFTQCKVKELMLGMVTIDFSFEAAALDTAMDFHVLPLGVLDFKLMCDEVPFGLLKREFDQRIIYPGDMSLTIEAPLPKDWEIVKSPQFLKKSLEWGEANISASSAKDRVVFYRGIQLKNQLIPAKDWSELRSWLLDAEDRVNNHIVFKSK